ncbi:Meiotic recombination protein SPO11-1 [Dendrobium catenatum]|uniref:Meiotic recombination protein SPO11-1 n=1 Tax=Dendrobium catenatum TaxID=906689 RepID=A0A2I0XDS7_9ASPA|nr:Meiotic recombination protein SPO11-1 [Dendrobium catenatum]
MAQISSQILLKFLVKRHWPIWAVLRCCSCSRRARKGERGSHSAPRVLSIPTPSERKSERSGEGEPALPCGSSVPGECGREGGGASTPLCLLTTGERYEGEALAGLADSLAAFSCRVFFSFALRKRWKASPSFQINSSDHLTTKSASGDFQIAEPTVWNVWIAKILKTAVWSVLGQQTTARSNLDSKSTLRKGLDSGGDIRKGLDSGGDIRKGLDSGLPPWESLGQQLGALKGAWTAFRAWIGARRDIVSVAQYILVVEKETVFQRLANDKFCERNHCIVITGRGYPDVSTRRFLQLIVKQLHLPVYCLVDFDPYGFDILATYRFGSMQMAYDAKLMRVSEIRWLGAFSSDFEKYKLPERCLLSLTTEDKKKAEALLSRCYLHQEAPQWRLELEIMLHKGLKFEIEALSALSLSFLSDAYIPLKIKEGCHI